MLDNPTGIGQFAQVTWDDEKIAGPAGEDLRNFEYHAGRLNANGSISRAVLPAECMGVLKGNPNVGDTATLELSRVRRAIAGGTFARNALVVPDARGRFVAAAAGQVSVVRALTASGADGQIFAGLVGRVQVA